MSKEYELGELGGVSVVDVQGLFSTIVNVNPLLLVLDPSFTVDVTVNVWVVACRETVDVEMVTSRPDREARL